MNISESRIQTITAAIASIGGLEEAGITNSRVASYRTTAFDLPEGKYHLTNDGKTPISRIKLTAHGDGTVDLRLIEQVKAGGISLGFRERETVSRIAPAEVGAAIAATLTPTIG